MTKTQLIALTFALITVVSLGGIYAWTSVKSYEKEAEINAQKAEIEKEAAVEQAAIEADKALARTKERMNFIPWYKGGDNKDDDK